VGTRILDRDLSTWGTGMGKKYASQAFMGIPVGFFCHVDGDGS
jgi:hypothetical protein